MDQKKIISLIKLLDDPDQVIFEAIEKQLIRAGIDIVPELEKTWEGSLNELLQERVENLIHTVQQNNVKDRLREWVNGGASELLEGVYILARSQFPELEYEEVESAIEKIKHDVWLELAPNLTALEKVRILNHIIFEVHKFSGNISNYYSPRNSYINQVLELKKGNPISIAIVYTVVAQRLGIPIYGVNLPKNFILAYKDEVSSIRTFEEDENDSVLFYINPFNRGAVFGRKEIDYFVKQQKIQKQKAFYVPCGNIEIVQRVILNLIVSYEKLAYPDKIQDLQDLYKIVKL